MASQSPAHVARTAGRSATSGERGRPSGCRQRPSRAAVQEELVVPLQHLGVKDVGPQRLVDEELPARTASGRSLSKTCCPQHSLTTRGQRCAGTYRPLLAPVRTF